MKRIPEQQRKPLSRILVIGSGGREHAIAWKLAQSPEVEAVYVASGNVGTAREPKVQNIPITDIALLADFAAQNSIDVTVVGPEAPLVAGIVDLFRDRGLKIFGPTQAAAQLESSKTFAKRFMNRCHIPTADYCEFASAALAHTYLVSRSLDDLPIVVKADWLAAGKGVVVAKSHREAHDAVDMLFAATTVPDQEKRIIIENCIAGTEASYIVMVDGRNVLALVTSQDHKRLLDDNRGLNTGGMGAISPAPIITSAMNTRVMHEIIMPAVHRMADEGIPYTGFLYAGLMIDAENNPYVLEFNCRLGDPETEVILMRLRSDLYPLIRHGANGTLDLANAEWDDRVALGVVLAAAGYPDKPRKGDPISGLPRETPDCKVFHAGTAEAGDKLVTAGGRVLCVTVLGDDIGDARRRAYEAVKTVHFAGVQYRKDIGKCALAAAADVN
ncbi:MAG: phosphoribosylamine--glycine ligase [Candidatus Moraniibacteriota bacterium]